MSEERTPIPQRDSVLSRLRQLWAGSPCDRCGVEGGERWRCEEKVENRIVKRYLCSSCSKTVFFRPYGDLPEREWVR